MEAYLDNSATTRCSQRVLQIVHKTMDIDYGNPSSLHKKGMESEKYVKNAAACIAKTLKVSEKEIYFTSGGTESNNLAVIGAAMANRRSGRRLVTTQIEHPSVQNAMAFLEEQGFEIIVLPVDGSGRLSLDALRGAVNHETILVSIMQVNNEVGSVQPLKEASDIIHEQNPKTLIHVDAVQSYGKMHIRPKKLGIDMLSASGHKIHAPKGVGFLYIKEKTKIKPILFGGGQQLGLRSGTHNVPGIAALGEAACEAYENIEAKIEHMYSLRDRLITGLSQIEGTVINGSLGHDSAPHIVNASVTGIRSEVLLHALEERDIYVSAGSACSSHKQTASGTLLAMHIDPARLESAVRFSFSSYTQESEIDYTISALEEIVPVLRRYARF